MRFQLFLHVLPIVAVLVAWAHQQVEPSLRITLVESLDAQMASDVLPLFEAELARQLEPNGRHLDFERIDLDGSRPDDELPASLADADLVVSFGTAAAVRSTAALAAASTPHLLALLPTTMAGVLVRQATARTGAGPVGRLETSPDDVALAILRRLLESRSGPPLRVGVLYHEGASDAAAASGRLPGSSPFIALPVTLSTDATTPMIVEVSVARAIAAARQPLAVDAFWLALDPTWPTVEIVQAISTRTGKPVLHAATRAAVAAGALMSLTPEPADLAREAATLARQLLESDGQSAALIGRRLGLALNLTTAARLGIVLPHDLVELSRGRLYR